MTDKNPRIQKRSILSKLIRFSFWAVVAFMLIIAVAVFGVHTYLKSNEKKILEQVSWLNDGSIACHEIYLSLFEDFPKASIVLKDVSVMDAAYADHGRQLLNANKLTAGLSIGNWRNQKFTIDAIFLSDGSINIYKDAEGFDNLKSLLSSDTSSITASVKPDGWLKDLEIDATHLKISMIDIQINVVDEVVLSDLVGTANLLEVDLSRRAEGFDAAINMDLEIDELTFNRKNGSYLADSNVKGKFQVDITGSTYRFEDFNLLINEEEFLFGGVINDTATDKTILKLINTETDLAKTISLLPDPIAEDIFPYKIKGKFYTKTNIILEKDQPSHVTVDFRLFKNDVVVEGVKFQDTYLSGRFINRQYDDHRARHEHKGSIRVALEDITTRQGAFRIASNNILINSNPIDKASIVTTASVSGPASAISEWYKSDKFFFENGGFDMTADVAGPINDIKQLIIQSRAKLSFSDIDVLYRPANVSIPINSLILEKEEGDAKFSLLTTTLTNEYDYSLDGGLKNLTSLLVDFSTASASSNVDLYASNLGWEDFVGLFGRPSNKMANLIKDEKASKQAMKETLRGIYRKFEPVVAIAIDTFHYFDKVDLYGLTTGVHFDNENILHLDSTQFSINQGSIILQCKLDITESDRTSFDIKLKASNIDAAAILPTFDYFGVSALVDVPELPNDLDLGVNLIGIIDDVQGLLPYQTKGSLSFSSENLDRIAGRIDFEPVMMADTMTMSSKIELSGSPKLFNDYFKNDQFIFQNKGTFTAKFDYVGNFSNFDDLISRSEIDLDIIEGAVLYEEADIVFELTDANLYLKNDTAEYVLNMRSDVLNRSLEIIGEIDHVSELFYGGTGKDIKTTVNIYSPVLNVEHATYIFESPTDTLQTYTSDVEVDDKSKSLLRGLFNRFDPDITVKVDSIIVSDKIAFTNFTTGAHLADSINLVVEQTDFGFSGGDVSMNAHVYIGPDDLEPITSQVNANNIDIKSFLNNLDYLNINDLENAELIDGILSIDLEFVGALRDLRFVEVFTDATLDFELLGLRIKGAKSLMEIGEMYKRSEQFEDIKFAPLKNSITINESLINIPEIEIQSTALNVFVEGYLDDVNGSNIWVTIPLTNLKKKYLKEAPALQGYAANKWKVFMEYKSEGPGDLVNKLRWGKRKFYRQRGILHQFKEDRKADRIWRRAQRKAEKTNK